ncbi:hypothetical protein V2G26_011974 [Clonostachys chloroleuca]|uniref:AB hydrolase-1 domain-containing protein n=1 Tax=Clonostachys chloroleuca TaxID=1926264 RepID=A0AA35PVB0_9HYPO|nr:unnamed protein product [Clonostachys chloroleuca]
MAATTTIKVPHLGGITAGYRLSGGAVDPRKPTLVLINSMCTTSALFESQFNSKALTDALNLLAIEPLGHGATSCPSEHFTYWDTAIMALQVMDALKINKAFALGTSQGGWMVVRMALLAPERILGLLPLGTSMDYESGASREKGCWDPKTSLQGFIDSWTSTEPTPDFVVDEALAQSVSMLGFSGAASPETLAFWNETIKSVYSGDNGRKKVRMATLNLCHRDGLLTRLGDVKCPVYWLQGPDDPVYGKIVPNEHIKLFTSSPEATITFVEGGGHFLNATSPKETEEAILKMVKKYAVVQRSHRI